ncbi:MAG: YeeE/YedE family protein [Gammaproteobacteria bacterium]|nr:YeeE/YedE family protein [Gammaproteobacteria bacterium]MDH5650893.1 YeeE/YedE family protein [Gammaproteobacteria bacterium]
MTFDSFFAAQSFFLWSTFIIALVMGMVVNKTNFCTMGAVSDLVNMGDTGRMRAWVLAGTVAMLGVVILEAAGLVNLNNATLPPYRGSEFQWGRYLLGGIMFGVGMTLASGCGNKTLIRIGGGNIKSIFVFIIIAVIAYYMVDPYKQLSATWYQSVFAPWLGKASISLSTNQDLGSIVGNLIGVSAVSTRVALGLLIAAVALFLIFRSEEFRKSSDNVLAGVVVGCAVLLAWYFTSAVSITGDEGAQSLGKFYGNWDFVMDSAEGKPQNGSTNLLPQSFTFISPIGQTLGYAKSGFAGTFLTFGVVSVLGVILGSLLWSLITRSFRIEWFASVKDFTTHVIGGVLMGFGGVLGLGCTVGQAITGVSTLALGSFVVFIGIVFGSALTMKIQYYKLVYEDDATFGKALVTSLVDMKLLPGSLRKLDAV